MHPKVPPLLAELADELRHRRDDYRQGQFAGALRTLRALGEIDERTSTALRQGLPELTEDQRWPIDVDAPPYDWPTMPFQGRRSPRVVPTPPGTEPLLALLLFDDGVALQWHADHPAIHVPEELACQLADDLGTAYALVALREMGIGGDGASHGAGVLGYAFFKPAIPREANALMATFQGRAIEVRLHALSGM